LSFAAKQRAAAHDLCFNLPIMGGLLFPDAGRQLHGWLRQGEARRWLVVGVAALALHAIAVYWFNQALRVRQPVREPIFMQTSIVLAPQGKTETPAPTAATTPAQDAPQRPSAPPAWLLTVADASLRPRAAPAKLGVAAAAETPMPPPAGQRSARSAETEPPPSPSPDASGPNSLQRQPPEASSLALSEPGRIVVRVLVSADGRARQVRMLRSSGVDRLDRLALESVRTWRFPPRGSGEPENRWVIVPVELGRE